MTEKIKNPPVRRCGGGWMRFGYMVGMLLARLKDSISWIRLGQTLSEWVISDLSFGNPDAITYFSSSFSCCGENVLLFAIMTS
jgi:hypothetical protein